MTQVGPDPQNSARNDKSCAATARRISGNLDQPFAGLRLRREPTFDLSFPVAMKYRDRNGGQSAGGAGASQVMVAATTLRKFGENGNPDAVGFIVSHENESGLWKKPDGSLMDGEFTFVRMLDGQHRFGAVSHGENAHGALAGNAAFVHYAGIVTFVEGRRQGRWNNASGTYVPAAVLRSQAGFSAAAGFAAQDQPTITQTRGARIAAVRATSEAVDAMIRRRTNSTGCST